MVSVNIDCSYECRNAVGFLPMIFVLPQNLITPKLREEFEIGNNHCDFALTFGLLVCGKTLISVSMTNLNNNCG